MIEFLLVLEERMDCTALLGGCGLLGTP